MAMGRTFVLPVLLLLIAMNIFPLLWNLRLAFTDAELSGGPADSVGLANFRTVFSDPAFGRAVRTTALFVVLAVGSELALGFALALLLRGAVARRGLLLTTLLVPMMLSPAVMGLFWNLILNSHYGILNQILGQVGLPQPGWLTDPSWKLVSILLIDVWMWTPFMMLIALAGLNAIPTRLYEAAAIDRARPFLVFRRITLPLVSPLLLLAVLFRTTDAVKQFDFVMAVTGPDDASTQTLSALLYQVAFRGFKVGLGAAYSTVLLVMIIALASVFTRYLDRLNRGRRISA